MVDSSLNSGHQLTIPRLVYLQSHQSIHRASPMNPFGTIPIKTSRMAQAARAAFQDRAEDPADPTSHTRTGIDFTSRMGKPPLALE